MFHLILYIISIFILCCLFSYIYLYMGGGQAKPRTITQIITQLQKVNLVYLSQKNMNFIANQCTIIKNSLISINKQYVLLTELKDIQANSRLEILQLNNKLKYIQNICNKINNGESIIFTIDDKPKYPYLVQLVDFYQSNFNKIDTINSKLGLVENKQGKKQFWKIINQSISQGVKLNQVNLKLKEQNQKISKLNKDLLIKCQQSQKHLDKTQTNLMNQNELHYNAFICMQKQNKLLQIKIKSLQEQLKNKVSKMEEKQSLKDRKISQLQTQLEQAKQNVQKSTQSNKSVREKIKQYEQIVELMQMQISQIRSSPPSLPRMERFMSENYDKNTNIQDINVVKFINNCKKIFNISKQSGNWNLNDLQPKIQQTVKLCKEHQKYINQLFSSLHQKIKKQQHKIQQNFRQQQNYCLSEKKLFICSVVLNKSKINIQQIQNLKISQPILKIQDRSLMFSKKQNEQFVVNQLQKYLKNQQIQRFNLLYRNGQKGNISDILQKHPNTLIIVQTKAGHTLAGYSSLSYCGTLDAQKSKGLILSTYSKIAVNLKEGFKAVQNNDQYLLFGKGIIKIKKDYIDKNVMNCNLATASSFNVKQYSLQQFINEVDSQIQINGYQIYEIILKNWKQISIQCRKLSSLALKSEKSNQSSPQQNKIQQKQEKLRQKQLIQLKTKITLYQQQIKQLKSQNQCLVKQIYQIQINKHQKDKQEHIEQTACESVQNQLFLKQNKQNQKLIQSKNILIQTYKYQVMSLKKEIDKLQSQRTISIQRINQLEKQIQAVKSLISLKIIQSQESQKYSAENQLKIKNQLKQQRQANVRINNQLTTLRRQSVFQKKIKQNISKQSQTEKYQQNKITIPLTFLFDETDLKISDEQKKYIIMELQTLHGKFKSIRTRLLYKYPIMNGCELHRCIDSKQNYVVFIRIKDSDKIIMLYSQKPLMPNQIYLENKSFIGSLTNKKIFNFKNNGKMKATTYDKYAIIFGLDITLSTQGQKVYIECNIGAKSGSYNCGTYDNQFMTGNNKDISFVQSYEIYQFIFQ